MEVGPGSSGSYWNQPVAGSGQLLPLTPSSTGVATYTFPADEAAVTIPFNFTNIYPPTNSVTVNFTAMSTVGLVESDFIAPPLTVNRAGLRFFNFTDSNQQLPVLMAGADSFAYSGKQLIVQLIQASPENPAVCTPLVGVGEEAAVQLVLECSDPATCSDDALQAALVHKDGVGTATVAINTLDDNGGSWIGDEAELGTAVNLEFENFGGNPGAWIRLTYPDVGDVQLHGRYQVPLNNDAAGAAGLSADYLRGSSSTRLRVRPFALDVDFNDDRRNNVNSSYAADASSSSVVGVAGIAESVVVSAVAWDADDDLDVNWVPDAGADLSDNDITASFGNESWFDYEVELSLMTDNPATIGVEDPVPGSPFAAVPGGVVGVLTQGGDSSVFAGGRSTFNMTYDEVGIIDVYAQLMNPNDTAASYGELTGGFTGAVAGGVLNVGRFVPFGFDLELPGDPANTRILERPDHGGAAAFTYMGEEFEVALALRAMQGNGTDVTQNYRGDFAKLDDLADNSPMVTFKAFEDIGSSLDPQPDVDRSARLGSLTNLAYTSAWQSGEATLSGRLVFNRQASGGEDGPYTLTVGVDLADDDGVLDIADRRIDSGGADETGLATLAFVDTAVFRYGRLVLLNAYGSELPNEGGVNEDRDVGMGLRAEYWNGSEFVTNEEDDGTVLEIDQLAEYQILDANPANDAGELMSGDIDALRNLGAAATTLADGETRETESDDLPFWFTAPGEGLEGSVLMEFDLDAADLHFLSYDWRGAMDDEDVNADADYNDNPRALLEFGVYRGNSRIINWQELFLNE